VQPINDNMTIGEIRRAYQKGRITRDEVNELFRPLNDLQSHLLVNSIETTFKSTLDLIKEGVTSVAELMAPNIRIAVTTLAKTGWFISDMIGRLDVFELVGLAENDDFDEVDRILSSYFKSQMRSIQVSLSRSYPKRRKILRLGFKSHKRKEYLISVPTFLIQADGICCDILGIQLFKKRNRRPAIADRLDSIPASSFDAAFFEPLKIVLPISEDTKLLDSEGLNFNRHSILHGLNVNYGTEINSLKSMSLLFYLNRIASIKRKSKA
jgi:hypothetical protein